MIAEFRDYLKTLDVADYYYIGKIENIKEKVLGIYADSPTRRVEAIGGNGSYGTFGVRLLLHWNKNANETEISARNLYEKIRYIKDVNMANPDISALVTEDDEVIETHEEHEAKITKVIRSFELLPEKDRKVLEYLVFDKMSNIDAFDVMKGYVQPKPGSKPIEEWNNKKKSDTVSVWRDRALIHLEDIYNDPRNK